MEVWKQDAKNYHVTCISPDCDAQGIPDPDAPGYPQVSCHACALRYCVRCEVPWHMEETCAEYGAKKFEKLMTDVDKDALQLMQTKDGKRCPNCWLVIEKDGGCNSMYCPGCHKYFNWATAGKSSYLLCLLRG
jgi:hypothetical protein